MVVFASPRKLPKPASLEGRVAVLDIAFAATGTGTSYEKVTGAFLQGLGPRLAAWIDHHDHEMHARFAGDPRFVLRKKSEHGGCPEMVTPDRVAAAGPVDTVVCHDDLDGLYSAAKFLRDGVEPYPGADADARAVDTRMGTPSALGRTIDFALRARPRDFTLRERVVWFLVDGAQNILVREDLEAVATEFAANEAGARKLAEGYVLRGRLAVVDATGFAKREGPYDKTLALLLGQERAAIAVVYDDMTVSIAAAFDSGIDLLVLLGVSGGMPTRVSVPRPRLDDVLRLLETQSTSSS
ncbi:MAG: hypothetical protein WCJ30_15705 [Deltaproteobacteria bacterium]